MYIVIRSKYKNFTYFQLLSLSTKGSTIHNKHFSYTIWLFSPNDICYLVNGKF